MAGDLAAEDGHPALSDLLAFAREFRAGRSPGTAICSDSVINAVTVVGELVCVALGLAVIVGWYVKAPAFTRFHPDQGRLVFNAGVALAVTGAALFAVSRGRPRAAALGGGFDIALGSVALAEDVLGRGLGIDRLFVEGPLSGPHGMQPGRLAVNTAICFVIVGIGLLVWGPWRGHRHPAALAVSGSLIAAVATVALFGYAAGVPRTYGWGHPTSMALPGAAAMIALAVTLLADAWQDARRDHARSPGWLAMPAGVLALGAAAAVWLAVTYQDDRTRSIGVSSAAGAAIVLSVVMAGLVALAVWMAQRANGRRWLAEAEAMRATADTAAAELKVASANLERSNAELEQFAHFASHDLAEPLRAIAGPISLLARRYQGQLDEEADEFIGFVVDGCQRMQDLIDGVLALSSAGFVEGDISPVDCNVVLTNLLSALAPTIEQSDATVTVGRLPIVSGNANQLTLVFGNLMANALKFVAGGRAPRVSVSAERVDTEWRVSVVDNGIGIDPRYRERIFGMFKRLHGGEDYPGTGVGLALVKKIVERHGGQIGVEDAPSDTGCRFWVTLPAAGEVAE
jgi:signal transduction histidine kinase